MKFVKMAGLGNDYVLIDLFQEELADPGMLAQCLCTRRSGIGADGLILLGPSGTADCSMRMFNPDGTEAEMCGNGIRCLARYYMAEKGGACDRIRVETRAGVREVTRHYHAGEGDRYEVNMGAPLFLAPGASGMVESKGGAEEIVIEHQGMKITGTPLSVGNPHFVVFVDDVTTCPVEEWGPAIERASFFDKGTNAEFVQVLDRHTLKQRTWERGAGETPACGTGATAAAAVAIAFGRAKSPVEVKLAGGVLDLRSDDAGSIYMAGAATEVFRGEIDLQ
jgi:diaminopimelate epimerase